MEHAGVESARGIWKDSLGSRSGFHRDQAQMKAPLHALHDRARAIGTPTWVQYASSEPFLRRAVPVLIAVFLTIVACVEVIALYNQSRSVDAKARTQLIFMSEVISRQLVGDPALETILNNENLAQELLQETMPANVSPLGMATYLVNESGKIVAAFPPNGTIVGAGIAKLTQDGLETTASKAIATAQTIVMDGDISALAIYSTLSEASGVKLGGLLITQLEQPLYSSWNRDVNINVTLFLALSLVLIGFLYAYFAQTRKSRETDELFLETNARFDTALARGHCGLWDWDLSRGRIVWSTSMYQMLGMEAKEKVMGYGELSELVHPLDTDLSTLANRMFSLADEHIDQRFRMLHTNGSWVWLRMRAELVRYKDAAPHLIGIAVDITEQEQLKKRSRDADTRLRDAIENISEAFVLWDSKRKLIMCNSKYQQLYNLPSSAVVSGASHKDVMSKSRKPRLNKQITKDEASESGTETFEAQLEDGRWLQVSERRTQDGGFVSVGTDISQIKRNQDRLVESEQRLMATIADQRKTQRQTELQAQRLVELAEKYNEEKNRAEAGSRAKSEFLANISHELRTPLNAIIGFSDIMRTKMFGPLGSEKYVEYAGDINHSGNFLLGVINDVLDMSKIEAGRFQLSPEPVILNELIDETVRIVSIQAEEASIEVTQDIPEDLSLFADRRAVKQILINLLSNAVKFTGESGEISIRARQTRNAVTLAIEDNGVGISKSALKRLGQPFEQVQDQFTKDHKGSGLGLAIAKSLAKLHGGTLKIRSRVGEGTMIAVRLPLECKAEPLEEDA